MTDFDDILADVVRRRRSMLDDLAAHDREMDRIVSGMVRQYGGAFRRLAVYDATGRDPGPVE